LRSFEQCQEDKQYGKAIGWWWSWWIAAVFVFLSAIFHINKS
jgi:hypothetical protein